MYKILIIDDNAQLCRLITKMVASLGGMEAVYEMTLEGGLDRAAAESFDVVFLDINLPDGSGLDHIDRLNGTAFPPEVIIITGHGDKHGAETAIRSGAWDFIQKGSSLQKIKLSLTRAIEYREQKREKSKLVALKRDAIVGSSPKINHCLDQVVQAANSDGPVFITGETGTGKELFARAIHTNCRLFPGDFVVVDCASLPDQLVESILFGHRKGAFTGAQTDQEGLIQQADGGTLFLDEIGELPMKVQKRFLRVIQEKRFRPVGAKREVGSNFRLISATHRDVSAMVDSGQFRKDLYFRTRSLQIELPPLRDRIEDIPALVQFYIDRKSKITGGRFHGLSPDFIDPLLTHSWPGNVRELFHTLDCVLAEAFDEPILFPKHLPDDLRMQAIQQKLSARGDAGQAGSSVPNQRSGISSQVSMKTYIEQMKRGYIEDLMQDTKGDISAACRRSGLSRAYLYQLLKKYHIQ